MQRTAKFDKPTLLWYSLLLEHLFRDPKVALRRMRSTMNGDKASETLGVLIQMLEAIPHISDCIQASVYGQLVTDVEASDTPNSQAMGALMRFVAPAGIQATLPPVLESEPSPQPLALSQDPTLEPDTHTASAISTQPSLPTPAEPERLPSMCSHCVHFTPESEDHDPGKIAKGVCAQAWALFQVKGGRKYLLRPGDFLPDSCTEVRFLCTITNGTTHGDEYCKAFQVNCLAKQENNQP